MDRWTLFLPDPNQVELRGVRVRLADRVRAFTALTPAVPGCQAMAGEGNDAPGTLT